MERHEAGINIKKRTMQETTYIRDIRFDFSEGQVSVTRVTDYFKVIEGQVKIYKSESIIKPYYKDDDYSEEPDNVKQLIGKYWEVL